MTENENYGDRPYHDGPWGPFRIVAMVIGGLVFAVVMAFLFGWLVMWLWNQIMPAIFGLKLITYWQAFGLIILAKLFFGGHCWGHGHRGDRWSRRSWRKHWRRSHGRDWDEWAPAGDYKNWKYYDDYWHTEGKAAFEAYLDKIKGEKKQD
jgi:hypothetical protein